MLQMVVVLAFWHLGFRASMDVASGVRAHLVPFLVALGAFWQESRQNCGILNPARLVRAESEEL
jgi:hypothetical protein